MYDLLIKNGRVGNEYGVQELDVAVKDEKIVALTTTGQLSDDSASKVIDATGKYVLPGGIDSHVHYDLSISEAMSAQSAEAGSRAGLWGGTTTYIDFSMAAGEESLISSIEGKLEHTAAQNPHSDYAMHAIMSGDWPLHNGDEIADAISGGVVSFKFFTAFKGSPTIGGLMSDDGRIYQAMLATEKHGGITMVHCEDECIIDYNIRRLYADGRPEFWNIGEALHPNLVFGPELYKQENGQRYMNYPPNKPIEHREALWAACAEGRVHTLASDDFTIPLERKLAGDTVDNVTGGTNSVETRMAIFWSEGVAKGKLSVEKFVDLTAAGPAKLFGIYGTKGVLRPGADADVIVMDPDVEHTFRQGENLHSDCDYSNWDGWKVKGFPVTTILRGNVMVDDGRWVGPQGIGKFVPGRTPQAV